MSPEPVDAEAVRRFREWFEEAHAPPAEDPPLTTQQRNALVATDGASSDPILVPDPEVG